MVLAVSERMSARYTAIRAAMARRATARRNTS
jgi:hypothetical protein